MITVDLRPGKQNRPKFLLSTSLLYKILPTNLGVCKPICLYFLCIISEEKQYYLSYRPRKKCSISQFSETNCRQSVFRKSWAFSESVQKMSKMTYTASRFSHLTSAKFAVNINRVTLQHNKKFITFINFFLFNGFITMCNLEKRLMRAAFWILLHAMSMNDWKQTAQRLKLQERLLTINKRNIIPWNIYSDNNFHSRRQVLKCF